MHYLIYKTTNLINGKFYIGKHQTKDLNDGYLGSGKLIRRAVKKYGLENFHKEILFECNSEVHMNVLEKILVVPDPELNYNLCAGGKGGFDYINRNKLYGFSDKEVARKGRITVNRLLSKRHLEKLQTDETYKNNWLNKIRTSNRKNPSFLGKKHTEATKAKMRKSKNAGVNNPNYGKFWITNGLENRLIKELDFIPEGWYKGRVKIKDPIAVREGSGLSIRKGGFESR